VREHLGGQSLLGRVYKDPSNMGEYDGDNEKNQVKFNVLKREQGGMGLEKLGRKTQGLVLF
jgi:hypothetical protein